LTITPGSGEAARWWAIRQRAAAAWSTRIVFGTERTIPVDAGVNRVLIQAVDQAGNVSAAVELRR
jgi:hypothetical protein